MEKTTSKKFLIIDGNAIVHRAYHALPPLKTKKGKLVNAKEFSVHQFFNYLKSINIKLSKNTLYNYLEFFNDAFIFFPLRRFSWSLKNIEQSISKIYVVDNGLIEAIVGHNQAKKFENLVFLSLLRKDLEPNRDLFYYTLTSSNGEVDFLIKRGRQVR